MNLDPTTPGAQPENTPTTLNISQSLPVVPVSLSVSGTVAPSSPLSLAKQPVRAGLATLHFVTPKSIAFMIVAWLVVIAGVSTVVNIKPKANNNQANVPALAAIVTPLNPEEEQKSDINKINDRLAVYYGMFGNYPATTQINSQMFRAGDPSFVKIGYKTYVDPLGAAVPDLATKPTKGQYHYMPTPVGCDSSKVKCTGYTLGATLPSGELYNLHSVN